MARQYGKMPRRWPRMATAAPQQRKLRVRISASCDLEEFSLDLQKMVARLQDGGVHSIASCTLDLELRDASGNAIMLYDDERRPVVRLLV